MEEVTVRIDNQAGVIDANFDEVKNYLAAQLEEYRTATFTDESIKCAKAIVADLRKQQTAFKGRISEVKKAYLQPFEDFKAKADELVALYDEPITFINGQVQDFVERQKAEKREVIRTIYEAVFEGLTEFTLENIYNPRWENATFKKGEIETEMRATRAEITAAITTIESFCSEATDQALALYRKDRNLAETIAFIQRYENQKREILERERERELERVRQEEREKLLAQQQAEAEKAAAVQAAKEETERALLESMAAPIEDDAPASDYIYSITMTEAQKAALEIYLDSCGLEWEVLNG